MIQPPHRPILVLMADDDPDDRLLTEKALAKHADRVAARFVEDGERLMDYLHRRGDFAAPGAAPRPDLVLLDLNMPRKDGREALREIKADPGLCSIPVVVFTTSRAEEEVYRSYRLGAASFITKPVTFVGLAKVMEQLETYWTRTVSLPPAGDPEEGT